MSVSTFYLRTCPSNGRNCCKFAFHFYLIVCSFNVVQSWKSVQRDPSKVVLCCMQCVCVRVFCEMLCCVLWLSWSKYVSIESLRFWLAMQPGSQEFKIRPSPLPVNYTLRCFRCGKARSLWNPENGKVDLGKEMEIIVFLGTGDWCEVLEKPVCDSEKKKVWFHTHCWQDWWREDRKGIHLDTD